MKVQRLWLSWNFKLQSQADSVADGFSKNERFHQNGKNAMDHNGEIMEHALSGKIDELDTLDYRFISCLSFRSYWSHWSLLSWLLDFFKTPRFNFQKVVSEILSRSIFRENSWFAGTLFPYAKLMLAGSCHDGEVGSQWDPSGLKLPWSVGQWGCLPHFLFQIPSGKLT